MSSYDDPRWYEQPETHDNVVPPSEQPESVQPAYPQFEPFPRYQSPGNYSALPQSTNSYPSPPPPQRRKGRKFGQFVVLLALLLITFLGGWFGNQLYANSFNPNNQSQAYSNLFQQAWSIVDQHYVDRKAVDYKQMSYKAIQSMLDVLHDKGHTRFLTPQDVQAENQQLSGTFTGVGIYLHQDPKTKQLIITSPIPGSPAEKAGLKHGDIITAINNVSTAGKDIPGVSALIQGKAGTSVTITVQRPSTGQTLKIPVVRAQITVPNVLMHYIAEDHIADIQMVQFASGVANQLRDAIQQAKKLGAHKIILDLRENPGGYLSEAVDTASEFMRTGNVLLEQDSSGNRTPYPVTGSTIDTSDPIVVLINGDTASAAEIVSGALQDNKRAILIGEKSFGTGTVLEEYPLSDGSAILLGTHEWLTPNGSFIRDNGIHPNIEVKLPANANILTPTDENAGKMNEQQILAGGDNQLVAAIHYLEKH
ncbi:MAG TPA: S41 family peptidase [Ktedonobacteraceae bacterium]|nr:S41 family peptidase [Ktedonobacteraceae bacterium]